MSSKPRTEYQLRCNVPIAIALAPELFTRALQHLQVTQEVLIQPHSLGIKTLDPEATEYVPYYANDVNYIYVYHNKGHILEL
jgi:glycogen debranching enzyme